MHLLPYLQLWQDSGKCEDVYYTYLNPMTLQEINTDEAKTRQ